MSSYVPPVFHATNDVWAVTDANGFAGDIQFLAQRPYFNYYCSVTTSIPSGAFTQVTLGGVTTSGYGFSVSSNNVIMPLTGTYMFGWCSQVPGNNTSDTETQSGLYRNGTQALLGNMTPMVANTPGSSGSGLISCSAGDTVGLYVFQNSGGAENCSTGAATTYISGFFVGFQ